MTFIRTISGLATREELITLLEGTEGLRQQAVRELEAARRVVDVAAANLSIETEYLRPVLDEYYRVLDEIAKERAR